MTELCGGVYRHTSTPHKSGSKIEGEGGILCL